jgi:hypothetical protein
VRRTVQLVAALVAGLALGASAPASELVTRLSSDPRGTDAVRLKVDGKGRAVLLYRGGHPLYWGAVNARPPTPTRPQKAFRKDYSGGWRSFHKALWRTTKDACRPYDGAELAWLVAACRARDGSYWAVQAWQRKLPNLGVAPWRRSQSVWEVHLSHWRGSLPRLGVYLDWSYSGRYHHLFGRFTYDGAPVYGFRASGSGNPLDTYGRNVYVDTLNSAYGAGWKRENSFLTHRPNGNYCYGFYPHDPYPGYPATGKRPAGNGVAYRLTAIGPGVTPVVMWQGTALPDFDRSIASLVAHENEMNALAAQLAGGDLSPTPCRNH